MGASLKSRGWYFMSLRNGAKYFGHRFCPEILSLKPPEASTVEARCFARSNCQCKYTNNQSALETEGCSACAAVPWYPRCTKAIFRRHSMKARRAKMRGMFCV